jgi:hypothetical protein
MTVSSMATGGDVSESDGTGSDVTGIDVIKPKVGHFHLSTEAAAVYIPLSAAKAPYSPRSAVI